MNLFESGEMYLETIRILSERGVVHSVDISEYMGFSKPSVSRAVVLLREGGYLTMERDGALHLTDDGLAVANKIYERHRVITKMLESIGVSPDVAADDACKIEHHISDETFACLKRHLESVK